MNNWQFGKLELNDKLRSFKDCLRYSAVACGVDRFCAADPAC